MGKKLWCKIQLGTWLEKFIDWITFGNGAWYAYKVAIFFGYQSCGCEERKKWLNNLTCKENLNEQYITELYEHLESLHLEYEVTKSKIKKQNLLLEIENVKQEIRNYEI